MNKQHIIFMINFHQYQKMKSNREPQMPNILMKFLIKIDKEGIIQLGDSCQYWKNSSITIN